MPKHRVQGLVSGGGVDKVYRDLYRLHLGQTIHMDTLCEGISIEPCRVWISQSL